MRHGPRYNLLSTKFIIDRILKSLTFNVHITYKNLKATLSEMYVLYVSRMSTHITRVPFGSSNTPPTNIVDDDAEILNLFKGMNSYRYNSTAYARGSSSSSSSLSSTACTQTSSNSQNALPVELLDYFNHN